MSGAPENLRALDLPTLDDLAPVLLKALDEDEAMSAFQVLVQSGYLIVPAAALDRLAAAEAQRDTLIEALRELHEAGCGCDRPGNPAACVGGEAGYAEPFAALAAVAPTEAKP